MCKEEEQRKGKRSPDGSHKLVSERFAGRAQDGVAENVKGTPVDLRDSRAKEWGQEAHHVEKTRNIFSFSSYCRRLE